MKQEIYYHRVGVNFHVFEKMNIFQDEGNEIKNLIITLEDFPFICRICCLRRNDLMLFDEEKHLLDLFQAIRKIDVRSTVNFPRNVCKECLDKLADISLFIDVSRNNDERLEKDSLPKREIQYAETSQSCAIVIKNEGGDENLSQICRICFYPSSLTPLEKRTPLMHLLQSITNIDVKPGIGSANGEGICDTCIYKLEQISIFISLSLTNDRKLENAISKSEDVEVSSNSGVIKIETVICPGLKLEKDIEGSGKDSVESAFATENNTLQGSIDVKEEIMDSEFEGSTRQDYPNTLKFEPPNPLAKRHQCHCCEKSFSAKSRLQDHLLTHTKERPLKCEFCEKSFARKSNLRLHSFTHSGKKPFECHYCGKGFSLKSHVREHLTIHTGQRLFQCDSCEKKFPSKTKLQHHVLTHTKEKPFQCHFCEHYFALNSNLKRHLLIHTREKPFGCDACDKSFSQRYHLKRHSLTHSGEKPHKCGFCEKRFIQTCHLKKHLLIHASKAPESNEKNDDS